MYTRPKVLTLQPDFERKACFIKHIKSVQF